MLLYGVISAIYHACALVKSQLNYTCVSYKVTWGGVRSSTLFGWSKGADIQAVVEAARH